MQFLHVKPKLNMAPEKQQPFDATQILNDITLVNQANKIEIEQIKEHLNLRISNAGLDGAIAETIIEESAQVILSLSNNWGPPLL